MIWMATLLSVINHCPQYLAGAPHMACVLGGQRAKHAQRKCLVSSMAKLCH